MKMEESSPNGQKTVWGKAKLFVTSHLIFSHNVFKRLVLQTRRNLFWIRLRQNSSVQSYPMSPFILKNVKYCRFVMDKWLNRMRHALSKGELMHLRRVSTHVSLRGLRRLTWSILFANANGPKLFAVC